MLPWLPTSALPPDTSWRGFYLLRRVHPRSMTWLAWSGLHWSPVSGPLVGFKWCCRNSRIPALFHPRVAGSAGCTTRWGLDGGGSRPPPSHTGGFKQPLFTDESQAHLQLRLPSRSPSPGCASGTPEEVGAIHPPQVGAPPGILIPVSGATTCPASQTGVLVCPTPPFLPALSLDFCPLQPWLCPLPPGPSAQPPWPPGLQCSPPVHPPSWGAF